jgi:hypothetical protein
LPEGDVTSLVLAGAGVVDEIRVSKGLRYGPFVPVGATNPPLVTPRVAASPRAAANAPHVETSEKDLDALRAKNISAIPETRANYTLGAAQALPAWEGMAGMQLLKDYFGKGADAVRLDPGQEMSGEMVRPSAVYWKLADVAKGKYYVGLWLETQDDSLRTEYSSGRLLAGLYLNGWPVRFSTTSDPVQVKPGIWLAELQTAEAVELKPGDELAVRPTWGTILRLSLYRTGRESGFGNRVSERNGKEGNTERTGESQPAISAREPESRIPNPESRFVRGHGVTGQTFGMMGNGNLSKLRLGLKSRKAARGEDSSVQPPALRGRCGGGLETDRLLRFARRRQAGGGPDRTARRQDDCLSVRRRGLRAGVPA